MKLEELRALSTKQCQHRSVVVEKRLAEILSAAETEKRQLTAEERSELDSLEAETVYFTTGTGRQTAHEPLGPAPWDRMARGGTSTGNGSGISFRNARTGELVQALSPEESFLSTLAPAGYGEPGEPEEPHAVGRFLHSILTGNQPEGGSLLSMSGQSGTGGGYLVNPQLSATFVDLARSASVIMRAGAQTVPMETSELILARLTQDPTGHWRPEGSVVTASELTFDRLTLRAKTLAAIVPVTIELLDDAANAPVVIENALQAALGSALDSAALKGPGAASEPMGIRNNPDVNTETSVGTPADYSDVTSAVKQILTANYDGEVDSLAWIQHPRDAATYDGLQDTTNQPMQPTPWAGKLQRLHTTSVDVTEGGGSDESFAVVGAFNQCVVGMRTSGVTIRVLESGQVSDGSVTHNAASELKRLIVAHLRADVALLRPTWFTVLSGITTA